MNFLDRIKQMFAPVSNDDVTNKQYVDGVAATKANASHQHFIGDVTSLQTALDNVTNLAEEAKKTAAAAVEAVGSGGTVSLIAQHATSTTSNQTYVISGVTPFKPMYVEVNTAGGNANNGGGVFYVTSGSRQNARNYVGWQSAATGLAGFFIIPTATEVIIFGSTYTAGTMYVYQ